jgi:hypothetical protein
MLWKASVAQEWAQLELYFAKLMTRIACMQANETGFIVLLHLDYRCDEHKPKLRDPWTCQYCIL